MKLTKRIVMIVMAAFLLMAPVLSMAMEEDGAGNAFATEAEAAGKTIALDLYDAGQNVSVTNTAVGASALLAGQNIQVNDSTIGGSLRAAGYALTVGGTKVDANATLAGYSIDFGAGSTAKGVYAAASTVTFSGECDALFVSAQNVTISGTVHHDVHVYADTVNIGSNAVIDGTLYVESAKEPFVAESAAVGAMEFTQAAAETAEAVEQATPMLKFVHKLSKLTMMIPGRILLALLFFFVIGGTLKDAASMVKNRAVAMPVSGFVTLISVPVAVIVLLAAYVTIPVSMLLLCLYLLAFAFCVSFAGCIFGQLIFPKMHGLLAAIIGVTIFSVARIVPVLGGIVLFASVIYTMGYFIQKIYLGWKKQPAAPAAPVAPQPTAELNAPAEEPAQQA